jgi:protein-S-isoprenylcysteine O-methyltransferase Ste14
MAEKGEPREGYVIDHPNRDKAASKATKAVVVLLLLVSAGLVFLVTIGGWSKLQGGKVIQIAYILLYLLFAFLVARWNRGILPVTAALAVILLIFAAVSTPAWFDRDKTGFSNPALDESVVGLLCFLIIPVQVLLVGFSMRGFQQAWNVEVERPKDGRGDRDEGRAGGAQPQPA